MMRGIIVVITALLSRFLLGRKQYAFHWLSLFLIVAGFAIVGFAILLHDSDNADKEGGTTVTGIILLLISQTLISGQLISEEKILEGYYLDPFFMVGIEGFWGVFIYSILLPIF
jgi:drug/metabolite transporter (DMT)-like permease